MTIRSILIGHIHSEGLLLAGNDGKYVNVKLLSIEGKFVQVLKKNN